MFCLHFLICHFFPTFVSKKTSESTRFFLFLRNLYIRVFYIQQIIIMIRWQTLNNRKIISQERSMKRFCYILKTEENILKIRHFFFSLCQNARYYFTVETNEKQTFFLKFFFIPLLLCCKCLVNSVMYIYPEGMRWFSSLLSTSSIILQLKKREISLSTYEKGKLDQKFKKMIWRVNQMRFLKKSQSKLRDM